MRGAGKNVRPSAAPQRPRYSRAAQLLWIDGAYRVRVAEHFGQLSGADYGTRRFEGQALRLPQRPEWWPGREKRRVQRATNSLCT